MNHPQISYHSYATLATLHKYRIGYTTRHVPWTNLTPPIRGGIYHLNPTTEHEDDSDETVADTTSDSATDIDVDLDDLSDASTLCTRTTSLEINSLDDDILRERTRNKDAQAALLQVPAAGGRKGGSLKPSFLITPEACVSKAIKGEIEDSLRDYPSLDPATQRAISSAYQALHQQVKDGGFYECRYSEYAKEMTRYLILFALFCTTLRCGWYLTSAAFLGLFWVCLHPL